MKQTTEPRRRYLRPGETWHPRAKLNPETAARILGYALAHFRACPGLNWMSPPKISFEENDYEK